MLAGAAVPTHDPGMALDPESARRTLEAIAHRVGFASRSHFTRAFQALFDASPAAFRTRG